MYTKKRKETNWETTNNDSDNNHCQVYTENQSNVSAFKQLAHTFPFHSYDGHLAIINN